MLNTQKPSQGDRPAEYTRNHKQNMFNYELAPLMLVLSEYDQLKLQKVIPGQCQYMLYAGNSLEG